MFIDLIKIMPDSNQELVSYIKQKLANGIDKQTIVNNLLSQGWQQTQIDQAFSSQLNSDIPVPMPIPPSIQNTTILKGSNPTMWDAFEHVLLFISLYVMATAIGLTLNFFVDKWFPAIANSSSYNSSYYSSFQSTIINGYIAALIVSTPIFALLFLTIQKRTIINPSIRNLKARKVLIYLTLIATFLIMLFQIITTVYGFLSGNLSFNFVLHLLVTVGISGLIFAYYTFQVKGDRKQNA